MKILWICNTLLPEAASRFNITISKPESWITGLYRSLKHTDAELVYLFPSANQCIESYFENTLFFSYRQKSPHKFEDFQIREFENILKKTKPDIIHIFGTEYPHSLAMIKAAENLGLSDKVVIGIQGLCSAISKHYFLGLDNKTIHSYTLRDFLKRDNIYHQMLSFKKRGEYEIKVLELAKNVIGRTDWDEACAKKVNPKIRYFFCNEILRKTFYKEFKWSLEGCEKHSIFVSQCSYPIKGFHYMLEAMADIVKKYPDAKLYTTGKNPLTLSFKQKLRQGYYNKYLGKLIKKYHLENNIEFLGFLKEEDMCERFLKSHVFVCSSTVENESNALSEAKILGVPSVVSFAGGMTNRIEHKKDGFLYPVNAPYMLSFYIQKIFEDDKLALRFSEASKIAAKEVNSIKANLDRLLEIYNHISNKI